MAIDTRSKRASILGVACAATLTLPLADATIDQGDRQSVALSYSGLAASPPAPPIVEIPGSKRRPRQRLPFAQRFRVQPSWALPPVAWTALVDVRHQPVHRVAVTPDLIAGPLWAAAQVDLRLQPLAQQIRVMPTWTVEPWTWEGQAQAFSVLMREDLAPLTAQLEALTRELVILRAATDPSRSEIAAVREELDLLWALLLRRNT